MPAKKPRTRWTRGHRAARSMAKKHRYYMRLYGNSAGNDRGSFESDPKLVKGPWVRRHWPIYGDM